MHKHPQSNNITYSILITHNKGENILPIVTKPLFLYIYFIPNRLLTLFPHIYIPYTRPLYVRTISSFKESRQFSNFEGKSIPADVVSRARGRWNGPCTTSTIDRGRGVTGSALANILAIYKASSALWLRFVSSASLLFPCQITLIPSPTPLSTDISLPCARLLNQSEVVPLDYTYFSLVLRDYTWSYEWNSIFWIVG